MNQVLDNAREIKWQLEVCLRGIADPETKILFLEESRRVIDRMIGNRMTLDQKSALNQLFEEIESACAEVTSSYNTQPIEHLRTTFADRVAEILKPKEGEG